MALSARQRRPPLHRSRSSPAPSRRALRARRSRSDDGQTRPLAISATDVLGATLDRGAVRLVSISADGVTSGLIGDARCVTDYDRVGDVIAACVTDMTSAGEVIVLRNGAETRLTTLGSDIAGARLRSMTEITATAPDRYPGATCACRSSRRSGCSPRCARVARRSSLR